VPVPINLSAPPESPDSDPARQDLVIRRQFRLRFALVFALFTSGGYAVGWTLAVAMLSNNARHFSFSDSKFSSSVAIGAFDGLLVGCLVGIIQFSTINMAKANFPEIGSVEKWALAAVIGFVASCTLAQIASTALIKTYQPGSADRDLIWSAVFSYSWLIVGASQWLVLRKKVRKAGWIIVAIGAGATVWVVAAMILPSAGNLTDFFVVSAMEGFVFGLAEAICLTNFRKAGASIETAIPAVQ
jgi:hypothetical protein